MGRALRILSIEDSQLDAVLLQHHLMQEGYEVALERVDTPGAMRAALETKRWDVILSDHAMPKFSAMNALALLKETGLDIPFIIISGTIGEELAVEAMLAGASDYLMKGRLTRLAPAIERELEEVKSRQGRRQAEVELGRLSVEVQRQREKHDQQLRDQHFYTRSLVESNIDALMATDPSGIVTDVNKQMEALTGCSRDELIGSPFRKYFTDSGRAQMGINRALKEGKVTNYELTALARDGMQTVVSYNATTFYDRDRVLQGVFAAARDMTELKLIEQTLKKQNLALEHASRLKSEFLDTMSHELRTPLNSIIGFSEMLRDGLTGEMTGQQREFTDNIFESGQHLLSLINDILDLSKLTSEARLDLEPVHVSTLLESTLSSFRGKAAARHIRLKMETAEDLGLIQLDVRRVTQIVRDLLSNAVKFNLDDGQVVLRAERVPGAEVGCQSTTWPGRSYLSADHAFEQFLRISVTDSGIGIAREEFDHLFVLFSQIDGRLARRFEGTGLGLAMVKLLTELHGGALTAESAVGEGSCFTVWLPVRTLEEGALK